jgi:hypothetical protein
MLEHKAVAKQMGIEARISVLERFELKILLKKILLFMNKS